MTSQYEEIKPLGKLMVNGALITANPLFGCLLTIPAKDRSYPSIPDNLRVQFFTFCFEFSCNLRPHLPHSFLCPERGLIQCHTKITHHKSYEHTVDVAIQHLKEIYSCVLLMRLVSKNFLKRVSQFKFLFAQLWSELKSNVIQKAVF